MTSVATRRITGAREKRRPYKPSAELTPFLDVLASLIAEQVIRDEQLRNATATGAAPVSEQDIEEAKDTPACAADGSARTALRENVGRRLPRQSFSKQ